MCQLNIQRKRLISSLWDRVQIYTMSPLPSHQAKTPKCHLYHEIWILSYSIHCKKNELGIKIEQEYICKSIFIQEIHTKMQSKKCHSECQNGQHRDQNSMSLYPTFYAGPRHAIQRRWHRYIHENLNCSYVNTIDHHSWLQSFRPEIQTY